MVTAKKIFIIDPSEDYRSLLTDFLVAYNFFVMSSDSPSKATQDIWDLIPDLIIYSPALGKNPYPFLKAVRSTPETSKIPFLLLPVLPITDPRIDELGNGLDTWMVHPIEPDNLLVAIDWLLYRSSHRVKKKAAPITSLAMNDYKIRRN